MAAVTLMRRVESVRERKEQADLIQQGELAEEVAATLGAMPLQVVQQGVYCFEGSVDPPAGRWLHVADKVSRQR